MDTSQKTILSSTKMENMARLPPQVSWDSLVNVGGGIGTHISLTPQSLRTAGMLQFFAEKPFELGHVDIGVGGQAKAIFNRDTLSLIPMATVSIGYWTATDSTSTSLQLAGGPYLTAIGAPGTPRISPWMESALKVHAGPAALNIGIGTTLEQHPSVALTLGFNLESKKYHYQSPSSASSIFSRLF